MDKHVCMLDGTKWEIFIVRREGRLAERQPMEGQKSQHDGKLFYDLMPWDIPKLGTQFQLIPQRKRQLGIS
jgi:hypothetical protein